MNVLRTTTISVTLSAGDIIRALRAAPGCPLDIQALPATGNGVKVEPAGSMAVQLVYVRQGEGGGETKPQLLLGQTMKGIRE